MKRGASAYEFEIRSVRVELIFWMYTGLEAALARRYSSVTTVEGACRFERIWLTGRPECSEKIRETGSVASTYRDVCRSTGISLALSAKSCGCANLDDLLVAVASLVGCASCSMGTYINLRLLNLAVLCKKLR